MKSGDEARNSQCGIEHSATAHWGPVPHEGFAPAMAEDWPAWKAGPPTLPAGLELLAGAAREEIYSQCALAHISAYTEMIYWRHVGNPA